MSRDSGQPTTLPGPATPGQGAPNRDRTDQSDEQPASAHQPPVMQRKRKPITECVGQYPLEAASELDDKVTEHSFDLKSKGWTWTGSRSRNGKLTADVSGSILSLQPDMDALALIEPMVDTSRHGSHVWPERAPKLNSSVQVFLRLEFPKEKKADVPPKENERP